MNLKKEGTGLGFSLEGGKDSPFGDRPMTIKKIFTGIHSEVYIVNFDHLPPPPNLSEHRRGGRRRGYAGEGVNAPHVFCLDFITQKEACQPVVFAIFSLLHFMPCILIFLFFLSGYLSSYHYIILHNIYPL